jgi:predicted phage-related endonuclease
MSERFLVRIATDTRIQRIVWRPMTMLFFGDSEMDVDVVYKSAILCDACNTQLYTGMEEEECPTGYVVSDGEYIYEAVCEDCRKRYYGGLPVYDSLEEAEER